MNVSEFVIKYLKAKGINHYFGYQGTMITYFVDAICREDGIINHSCYNEQGASLAACGYAKASGKLAVAYSTSGPGAINMLQGIADAFYDSTPVIFITGQLNLYEYSSVKELRQQGFQETNVIEITKSITKYNVFINDPIRIVEEIAKAVDISLSGRKGPVVIDIPMDMQRSEIPISDEKLSLLIEDSSIKCSIETKPLYRDCTGNHNIESIALSIISEIEKSSRPVFLLGNGISKDSDTRRIVNELVRNMRIPVLTSLLAIDLVSDDSGLKFGYIGSSYGQRCGNIIANVKTDLIISLGCRLCTRQTGVNQQKFAKEARILRVDIDPYELERRIHNDDICIMADVNLLLRELVKHDLCKRFDDWISVCNEIKTETERFDSVCESRYPNKYVEAVSDQFTDPLIVIADVGQNMMWTAQSFKTCAGQHILFSGAHGAMGFALPAAIGAYYGTGDDVICFSGDGGFQMNIQELQWISREQIPIKIFVFNNNSLGMICQVQDSYLEGRRIGTSGDGGFTSPSFARIAEAYGIKSFRTDSLTGFSDILREIKKIKDVPCLVEIVFHGDTEALPKTYFGEEINNQRPHLPKDVYDRLMAL